MPRRNHKDFVKNFKIEYDADFHIVDMLKRKAKGELDFEIAAAWRISLRIFKNWLKENEPLQEAYEIAQAQAWSRWIKTGKENIVTKRGETFNHKFFNQILRYQKLNLDDPSLEINLNNVSFDEAVKLIYEKVAKEDISIKEAKEVLELLVLEKKAKVDIDIASKFDQIKEQIEADSKV